MDMSFFFQFVNIYYNNSFICQGFKCILCRMQYAKVAMKNFDKGRGGAAVSVNKTRVTQTKCHSMVPRAMRPAGKSSHTTNLRGTKERHQITARLRLLCQHYLQSHM